MTAQPDDRTLRIAAFVAQALELQDDPGEIVGEIDLIRDEPDTRIAAIELQSSAGPVAFLVYLYALGLTGADGMSGAERYRQDLATMERAGELNTPGPRVFAHATTDDEAFILATTPANLRTITGAPPEERIAATLADLPPGSEVEQVRRDSALAMMRLITEANEQAGQWLAAMRAASAGVGSAPFTEEETALALHLLDEQNVQSLLTVMNTLIQSARGGQAGG